MAGNGRVNDGAELAEGAGKGRERGRKASRDTFESIGRASRPLADGSAGWPEPSRGFRQPTRRIRACLATMRELLRTVPVTHLTCGARLARVAGTRSRHASIPPDLCRVDRDACADVPGANHGIRCLPVAAGKPRGLADAAKRKAPQGKCRAGPTVQTFSTNRKWWPGRESNPRHGDFQSPALPTELPGRVTSRTPAVKEAR